VAQATASLYGVKTYPEQLAFKEKALTDDLFLKLPATIRFVCWRTIWERMCLLLIPWAALTIDASSAHFVRRKIANGGR